MVEVTFPYVPTEETPIGVDSQAGTITLTMTREQAEELFTDLFIKLTDKTGRE